MADKRELIAGALRNMGYKRPEAEAAAAKLSDLGRPLADLMRDALQYASGGEPAKKSAPVKTKSKSGPGFFARIRGAFSDWKPENKRLAMVGSGLTVGGLLLGVLVGRKSGASSAEAAAGSAAPPSPPPAKETVRSGATLTVRTPRGAKQPGVLRAGPGIGNKLLATVPHGTVVSVLDSGADAKGARWYSVQTPDGKAGWMHGDILA